MAKYRKKTEKEGRWTTWTIRSPFVYENEPDSEGRNIFKKFFTCQCRHYVNYKESTKPGSVTFVFESSQTAKHDMELMVEQLKLQGYGDIVKVTINEGIMTETDKVLTTVTVDWKDLCSSAVLIRKY